MPPTASTIPADKTGSTHWAFQQLCLPERGGSRQHQNSHRRKRQRLGKFQKQQSARHTAQQGGGAVRPGPAAAMQPSAKGA